MADNIKDVALNLKVAASGNEQIKAVTNQLEELARQGGQAAPEFKRLADELRAVGAQSDALLAFGKLEGDIEQATEAVQRQRAEVSRLKDIYEQQNASTEELRQKQQAAVAAFDKTTDQLRETTAQMRLLKTGQTDLVEGTKAYENRLDELRKSQATLRNDLAQQRTVLRDTNEELKRSETSLKGVSREYSDASTSAERLERSLGGQREQLNAARNAMAATGVSATTLASATKEVGAAIDLARAKTDQLITAEKQLQSVQEAVAASNAKAVTQAQAAANARIKAAKDTAEQERVLQTISESRALAEKLAAEQQIAAQRSVADYIAQSNERNVGLARRAAAERITAAKQVADAERATAASAEASALKQKLAYDGIEANIKQVRLEAQALADRLQQAMSVTGAKAAQDLEREIDDVRQAMTLLRTSSDLTGKELDRAMADGQRRINQLERDLRAATGQMTLLDRTANAFKSSIGQFTAGFLIAEAVQRLAVGALEANKNMETLQRGLKAVYGDARIAAQQIDFLKKTANDAGISVNDIAKSFVQFSAAMKTSGFSLQVTQDLFKGITAEAANLGLSGDKVADMLNALGQIASKGTVQLEELKNQLGDALPGALKRMADALGITLPELLELTSSGKLLAEDALPALSNALKNTSSDASTFAGIYASLKNTLSEVAVQVGDTGVWTTLKVVLLGVGTAAATLGQGLQFIFDAIFTGVRQLGAALSILATGDFRTAFAEMNRIGQEFVDRQAERGARFGALLEQNAKSFNAVTAAQEGLATAAQQAAPKVEAVGEQMTRAGTAAEEAGTKAAGAAADLKANAAAQTAAAAAAKTNAVAQTTAGTAVAAAGNQAAGAGNQWIKLELAYGKVNKSLEEQVKNATVATEAAKNQAKSIETLTQLSGNEAVALRGSAEAAKISADAQRNLAERRKTQVEVMQAERDALIVLKKELGDESGARQKRITELEAEIAKLSELAIKDREAAEAARLELEQKKLAAEVYQDNAGRLDELQKAAAVARTALNELTLQFAKGRITAEEYAAGVERSARAIRLEADALADSIVRIESRIKVEQANTRVTAEGLQLQLDRARTSEVAAKAIGNETLAIQAQLDQKRIQAQIIEAEIRSKANEIRLFDEATEKIRQQFEAMGPLTQTQKDELEIRRLNSEAMRAENAQRQEGVRQINAEADAIRNKNAAVASGIGNSSAGQQARSTVGGATYDDQGFATGPDGQRITAGSQLKPPDNSGNWEFISDMSANGGSQTVTLGNGRRVSGQGVIGVGYWVKTDGSGGLVVGARGARGAFGGSTDGSLGAGFGVNPTPAPAPYTPTGGLTTPRAPTITPQPVVINVNGVSTQITVSNMAEVRALQDLLTQLANAAGRSGA